MTRTTAYALSPQPLPPLLRVTRLVVTWDMRRRTRKDLRALSDHLLHDIGLDPKTAVAEASKPFWRA